MTISALCPACCHLVVARRVRPRCCSSSRLRHPVLSPPVRACCRLLRRVRTAGVFEGDVKGGPECESGKVLCGLHVFQLLTYLPRQQVTGMAFLNACAHGPYWSLCETSSASTSIYSPCAALLSAPPPITSPSVFNVRVGGLLDGLAPCRLQTPLRHLVPGTPRVSGRRGPVCVWAGSFRLFAAMGELCRTA